jgi:hypothetical protein
MSTTIEEKMKEIAERAASVDEAKGLAVFDGKITPADTYKEAFAQYSQVTPSNEIDYSNTKGEMPKVENPDLVDKIDPNIVKSPMEVVKDAKEAQLFSDYISSLYSQSDYEADEKRKKAAQWVTAAQILGDSLAALGNVYWTGKGAAPQQLSPGTGKAAAATHQLEQDIRNAREKAAKAKMDATLKKYELEMQRQDKKQTQENWQKTFDANEAYRAQQQKNFEKTEARLAEQARLNAENEKIRIDIAKQNANIQLKNALDKNKPYPMAVNGEIYEIPIKKVNEQIIGSIFAKLPEEVRNAAGQPIYGEDMYGKPIIKGYKNPSLSDMLAAIGTYGNEETAKEIMKLAGVKVEEAAASNTEEVDSKEDKREKENTSTNNTEPPIQAYSAPAEEWASQWRRRTGLDTTDFSQFKRK